MVQTIYDELRMVETSMAKRQYSIRGLIGILVFLQTICDETLLSPLGSRNVSLWTEFIQEGQPDIDLVNLIGQLLHSSDPSNFQIGVLAARTLLSKCDENVLLFSNTIGKV